ncbi:MAG: hypothetical protein DWQ19_11010 [Crenarchaeota archaeon]|nr:MAG: hypothetical protein DWQ19_11010 [Thermoproteota archaeon]
MFNTPKNIRKFQCFVCARQFESFEEFVSHIVETHEEGTDYVLCPLERCKAPVRDVRSHFKVKHPTEKLPQKGMLKATVWRDVTPKGKIKKRKPKFREGWHHSTKMEKNFYYRSGYEKTVYECFDSWHEVLAYEAEPFQIPYIHEGQCHQYTPDVFIAFIDGHKEVWEVKPANQTLLEKNQNKWFSAKQACEARGWEFVVATEQVIQKLKKKVKNQFLDSPSEET